ncbi:MAG: hypothetical protein H7Z19_03595 [Chitinophagaceae bacterium]|nr:hypothetical protein [Rubrivivax sp.]
MDDKTMTGNENRDPLSGEPGAHPIGTGVGATLGAVVAGAAAGSIVGPIGTVIGMAIGATLGGLAGKGVAENIDPTAEDAYWRNEYRGRPYVDANATYDNYGPAYSYGVAAFGRYEGRHFELIEPELARDWNTMRGRSDLSWDQARPAVRDAWQRMSEFRSAAGAAIRN